VVSLRLRALVAIEASQSSPQSHKEHKESQRNNVMHHTRLHVICTPELSEILIAELAQIGFDSFMETESGFEAYAEGDNFDKNETESILRRYNIPKFSFDTIQKKNWNEEWEKNYEPINVDDKCLIRAEFHKPAKKFDYEIIITPKMSFGTGHHQTTYLMIRSQMKIDHTNKRVMDAGCGTAILSIMASKLGAKEVEAFDIDEWSVVNGNENSSLNSCNNINIQQGTIEQVKLGGKFDIILANINKNVLLKEMRIYSSYLTADGLLLLSGFYTSDIPDLLEEGRKTNLSEISRDDRENWASLLLKKS
jgi:ribosomal protein L11 methyltransferase